MGRAGGAERRRAGAAARGRRRGAAARVGGAGRRRGAAARGGGAGRRRGAAARGRRRRGERGAIQRLGVHLLLGRGLLVVLHSLLRHAHVAVRPRRPLVRALVRTLGRRELAKARLKRVRSRPVWGLPVPGFEPCVAYLHRGARLTAEAARSLRKPLRRRGEAGQEEEGGGGWVRARRLGWRSLGLRRLGRRRARSVVGGL